MADTKNKPANPQPIPLRESVDFGEAALSRNHDRAPLSVSQRVPITPAPPRPPEKDKK
jgi:hypothetical protein